MPPLRRRKRTNAPSVVYFHQATNEAGNKQACVYAECLFGGGRVGPIWGHSEESVRRALATLKTNCDCPAKFHKASEYKGRRIVRR